MPELPEVERVRLTLQQHLVGRQVLAVHVHRPSVITGRCEPADLLAGERIKAVIRQGKQLAIVAERGPVAARANAASAAAPTHGRCVHVHLGMTGSLRCWMPDEPIPDGSQDILGKHMHVVWELEGARRLVFRDPRRFGGIWTFADMAELNRVRWQHLGPDALVIQPRALHARLRATRRPIKAALLDQAVVAGLGNIYVDELLHLCRVAPHRSACDLSMAQVQAMVRRMRKLLDQAIQAGGSSLRDYVDVNGASGRYQDRHLVYGRGGLPCRGCRGLLAVIQVAGRTTVYCPTCQPASG